MVQSTTTTLLEYALLVYVMVIVVMCGLYIMEHFEIRRVIENEAQEEQTLLI